MKTIAKDAGSPGQFYSPMLAAPKSSQALMVTSLGEDSFIQPPSPIHQKEQRMYDSKYKLDSSAPGRSPDDRSELTFIKQGKGNDEAQAALQLLG